MPKMLSDARRKLVYVPTLINFHAPLVSELSGSGVLDLSCLVTAADFSLGATGEDSVNDPALCAEGNDASPGRVTYEAGMNFFRWTTTAEDKAWTTFTAKGIGGYLVQRIGKRFDIAFAAADQVQVYQVITGTPMIQSPTGGGFEKFRQMFYVQSAGTDERATVAA
jgi:hypothetical protein